MRDLYSNLAAVAALAPAVLAASANGAAVDVSGASRMIFVLSVGAIAGAGDFGAKVQESADGATWADAADKWVKAPTLDATLEADTVYRIGYDGKMPFARLVLTKAGGTSIAASAVAILRPHRLPVA